MNFDSARIGSIAPTPDFNQLLTVLWRRGRPDYVPFYELYVDQPIMERLLGKPITDRASTIEFYYKAGYDYAPAWPGLTMKVGSLIDQSVDYPITDWESFEKYPWPDPAAIDFKEFEAMAPLMPEGMKIIGQTGGIFERAQELCGYVGLCMLLRTDRELVRAIFDRLSELYVTMYRGMAQLDAVGALVISDDLGFKTQTLVAPEDLREFAFPQHKRLVQLAHEAGKPCIMHSCGNLAEIMDDLIDDVGIDAKHSYEDVILPVAEAKRLYGERLTILGGFDLDQLCRGSEEEIRRTTRRLLAECGATGGYALGSGNSIAHYVPAQNYLTLLDEGWKMRKLS